MLDRDIFWLHHFSDCIVNIEYKMGENGELIMPANSRWDLSRGLKG